MSAILERKLSHLDICAERDVESSHSTLLEEVPVAPALAKL